MNKSRIHNTIPALGVITCLTAALCSPSTWADKSSDTLAIGLTSELDSVDSYFNSTHGGLVLQRAIWDGLVYRDPATNEFKGNLATGWRWIDDLTLEFELREDVKFHNGENFTANDVVYTINFIADENNDALTQSHVNWIKSAEIVDDFTVRINLKEKPPAAIELLSGLTPIYPSEYYEKLGSSGMSLNPIGTGPYKVIKVEPGQHVILEKNENYHSSPKGSPSIKTIDIRAIPDVNTQIAELLNGSLDLITQVPAKFIKNLSRMDNINVANTSTIRIGFLTMDSAGRTGEEDNPFTNVLVRRAINHAIDREAIVAALIQGNSQALSSACFPGQFGCEQDVTNYEYDPEKAMALLTEAGYPDGFTTPFYTYRDLDYAQAITSYLNVVGIKTDLEYLSYPALRDKYMKGEIPFSLLTWGSHSINDVSSSVSQYFKHGSLDNARDNQLLEWLTIADNSISPNERLEYYSKALKKIADQAYWAPMFTYNTHYAFNTELNITPTPDDILHFIDMSWK